MFSRFFNQLISPVKSNLQGSGIGFGEFVLIIFTILTLSLTVRFIRLGTPSGYYFDEVYHAMTVKLIARNDKRAYEYIHGDSIEPNTYVEWLHPPLAKYFQALGVLAFGENGFGWRFSGALFGVMTIFMTGLLAWKLFQNINITLTALALASLETLLIVQSRIAMNDIFLVFFVLLSAYLYLLYRDYPSYRRLLWVGFAVGLTLATKWSGLFIGLWMIAAEGITTILMSMKQYYPSKVTLSLVKVLGRDVGVKVFALIILPLLVYVASYWQMFSQGKDFAYFIDLHQQILGYQTGLEATHPYQSTPIQWFFDTKPVWYYVDYSGGSRRDVYATGNPIIFWFGGLFAILLSIYLFLPVPGNQHSLPSKSNSASLKLNLEPLSAWTFRHRLLVLTSMYWIVWLPWAFSPRIMFFYHYIPAVPFLCIILAVVIVGLWGSVPNWFATKNHNSLIIRQVLALAIFSAAAAAFIWILPNAIALQVPQWWKNSLSLGGLWK